jgi:hypothetical protein
MPAGSVMQCGSRKRHFSGGHCECFILTSYLRGAPEVLPLCLPRADSAEAVDSFS